METMISVVDVQRSKTLEDELTREIKSIMLERGIDSFQKIYTVFAGSERALKEMAKSRSSLDSLKLGYSVYIHDGQQAGMKEFHSGALDENVFVYIGCDYQDELRN